MFCFAQFINLVSSSISLVFPHENRSYIGTNTSKLAKINSQQGPETPKNNLTLQPKVSPLVLLSTPQPPTGDPRQNAGPQGTEIGAQSPKKSPISAANLFNK